uniref:E3 ubiquitin-protein ligase RMA n=1 Tax=Solanum chacoense TaxID=4108 RepID=A0A0V0HSV0_SOLCH
MQNSTATTFESSSSSGNGSNDAGDFECNICFELAQDPIVTLCGHLYCWPCLYRWLRLHSQSHECPVCKALIQEEKLVPLYGRGRTSTDPRSKPVPGVEIPRRPAGQRPETAPPPESNTFPNPGFGLMGGLFPGATASFGNFTMSAGFGGLFPSLLNFQFNGFQGPAAFGTAPNYSFGYPPAYHGANVHNAAAHPSQGQADNNLKFMFLLVGFLVFLYLFGY